MKFRTGFLYVLWVAVVQGLAALPAPAQEPWKPVEPAQLALKAPAVDKDADAEILFWEVRLQPQGEGAIISHYLRIKIFTERGRESQSKVEFFYPESLQIKDVAGRTIKADGTIVNLTPDSIYERVAAQADKLKVKSTAFAMPAVEPGALIEYRWREVHKSLPLSIHLQRDIPIQSVTCYVPAGISAQYFNLRDPYTREGEKGQSILSLASVPAFHEEPDMPPTNEVVPWVRFSSGPNYDSYPASAFWQEYGRVIYEQLQPGMKVSDEVRRTAVEAMGDAATPEQKIQRLFEFCRSKIQDIQAAGSTVTADELARWKENKTPADTLRRRMGTSRDILLLFASLARAAGFDARYAVLAGRDQVFFNPAKTDYFLLDCYDIAVRVGNEWRFFDPASPSVPYGMLRWQEEGVPALISDPRESVFVKTQLSPPENTRERRFAKLRLSEDGTLEGEVRIEDSGHFAAGLKSFYSAMPAAEREKTIRDYAKTWHGEAEITEIRIENVTDPVKPFVYSYRVRVAGYASRTGRRLFVRPGFFQHTSEPRFIANEREHPVSFSHSWQEEDVVTFELPAGFVLDHPESSGPLVEEKVGKYETRIEISDGGRILQHKRNLTFDGGNGGLFPASAYPQLKTFFDAIHERDIRPFALTQGELAVK